jgi:hypothetical protein
VKIINIDNTQKNKVTLNPLVTVKQPKKCQYKQDGKIRKKQKRGQIYSPYKKEKSGKTHSSAGECIRVGVTLQAPLPLTTQMS